ncbi:MAG: hypothetical protein CL802_13650 [Citromicrobium sp.]|nr:hypothetical protein [Citromicrobium sp.]
MKDGRYSWHWKPSPRLRRLGWKNEALGITVTKRPSSEVIAKATAINDRVAAWEAEAAQVAGTPAPPRKWRFCDLVTAYRASPEFARIAPATRREYEVRLGQLEFWAQDGKLPIRDIDRQMVVELKDTLLAPREDGSDPRFKCAAILRVLRLLMRWGMAHSLIEADPTLLVPLPTAPARSAKLDWRAIEAIHAAHPDDTGALALLFGFWTLQRRDDLRQLNRFQWRELHGYDPRDAPVLVDSRGRVMGFRLKQHKTGRNVDCPLPPFLHPLVDAAFDRGQWLFPHSQDPAKPISGDVIRRRAKPMLDAAGFDHIQLRDMRRSGMSWLKDMGANKSDVFAISGHPLDGQKRTMADTYMPPDTRSACAAIAAAERTRRMLAEREEGEAK